MNLEVFRQIFEKYLNTKFNKIPSSERRVVACRQTGMTKLIVVLRDISRTLENDGVLK
jgi:hypothetical protein